MRLHSEMNSSFWYFVEAKFSGIENTEMRSQRTGFPNELVAVFENLGQKSEIGKSDSLV